MNKSEVAYSFSRIILPRFGSLRKSVKRHPKAG